MDSRSVIAGTWIVIPLFNEGPVVEKVVRDVLEVFEHVVCVDDGSTDDSAERAAAGGAVVVRHPINLGAGAAIRTGLDYALLSPQTRFCVTFDADGQHQVADALAMVEQVAETEVDILIGSRFLDGRTKPGLIKKIVLRTAVMFERLSTGVRLTDAHNGLRVFNKTVADGLNITMNGMSHASEIITLIIENKWRVAEEPVEILYTDYSLSKGQPLLNGVNILFDGFLRGRTPR